MRKTKDALCKSPLTSLSYDLYSVLDTQKAVKNTLQFVVGSLLCSERFFSGYSSFPLSSKTNITKFQFYQESGRRRWLCGCATSKSSFIYFINYMYIQGWRKLKDFSRTYTEILMTSQGKIEFKDSPRLCERYLLISLLWQSY